VNTVIVFRPFDLLRSIAFWVAAATFAFGFMGIWVKRIPFRWAFLVIPVVGYPPCLFASVVQNLAPWERCGKLTDHDGTEYCFLDSSFLQGQTLALARLEQRSLLVEEYKILVTTNGDSPRSFIPILRPDAMQDGYGQVYLTPNRMLLGIRRDNLLYMGFDLTNGRAYGRGDVETLSPFLCLQKDTVLKEEDKASIRAAGIGDERTQLRLNRIEEALQHENEQVRAFARELLRKGE